MFEPEINFLKDQSAGNAAQGGFSEPDFGTNSTGGIDPLLIGVAVPVLALAVVAGLTLFLNTQVSAKTNDVAQLDGRLAQLTQQLSDIENLKKDIETERLRVEAVVNLFDLSRPWSAVLEDLRRRVPEGVWLDSLVTKNTKDGDFIDIEGKALDFQQVAALQLTLKDSPFASDVFIQDTTKEEDKDGGPTLVNYKIQVQLARRKLRELIPTLEATGSVGILEKLRRVQQETLVR